MIIDVRRRSSVDFQMLAILTLKVEKSREVRLSTTLRHFSGVLRPLTLNFFFFGSS